MALLEVRGLRTGYDGIPVVFGIARDRPEEVERLIRVALDQHDVMLTSAGASVGEHDHVRPALERAGVAMDFWRVAIRPGKPLAFGRRGATRVFALPGNPASSLVTFELFVRPALLRLGGRPSPLPVPIRARSGVDLKKNNVTVGKNGRVRADVFGKSVIIEGEVDGNLFAQEQAILRQSGAVRGNITAPRVILEDGSRFRGSIDMDAKEPAKGSGAAGSGATAGGGASAALSSMTETRAAMNARVSRGVYRRVLSSFNVTSKNALEWAPPV